METSTALVVYESLFGNTEQIASSVARGLHGAGFETTLVEVSVAPAGLVSGTDLLVVGAPTHAFSLSRSSTRADAVRQGAPEARGAVGMREWLSAVRLPDATPPVAVFDTRVAKVRRLPFNASRAATNLVVQRGLRLLTEPAYFLVEGTSGPLVPGELERAVDWGRALGAQMRSQAQRQASRPLQRS